MKQPHPLVAFLIAMIAATGLLPAMALAESGEGKARGLRAVATSVWVEEWDPAAQRWVRVEDGAAHPQSDHAVAASATSSSSSSSTTRTLMRARGSAVIETVTVHSAQFGFTRRTPRAPGIAQHLAQYGPFLVIDETRAALVGSTDVASPRQFDAMLRDYPRLAVMELVDAPGTSHDLANLALGRKIRAAGLETHVPAGGSVRSGAVELFLAGTRQSIAPGATFAVHSWMDTRGLEPRHFAEDAPENRLYLDYYVEMGMAPDHARAFYAMTNSVPHSGALWLDADTMQRWVAPMAAARPVMLASRGEGPITTLGAAFPLLAQAEADIAGDVVVLADQTPAVAANALLPGMAELETDEADLADQISAMPVLAYGDLGAFVLARLDSGVVFP